MTESMRAAIAAQYAAFTARQPRAITACPCCTEPADLQRLVAAPREALKPGTLERYAHKAMTTIGYEQDFRYFWPRLAELCVEQRLITGVEIAFGKPLYGRHHTWPAGEQTALLGLASALGEWIAAEAPSSAGTAAASSTRDGSRSVATAPCVVARRSCWRSLVAMTYVHAAHAAGFKKCCMRNGQHDGVDRHYYYREE